MGLFCASRENCLQDAYREFSFFTSAEYKPPTNTTTYDV